MEYGDARTFTRDEESSIVTRRGKTRMDLVDTASLIPG